MKYVLITPARNEADYIELTIGSMINQTRPPLKWVIVSDGSTDGTDEIVKKYLPDHPWIDLVRMPQRKERHFAGKVMAFNTGYEKVRHVPHDIIGNLDADISFDEDYFEFLISKFAENKKLGVAGTPFLEDGKHYDFRFASTEHVSGACQLFRKECFEEIGGYIPIKGGGIDWTAVTTARMKGWKTQTFVEKTCVHHRQIGTGGHSKLMSHFKYGEKNYFLGGHPLWHTARSIFQMKNKPYIIGGILLFWGYFWAFLSRKERSVSPELMKFYRAEQMMRLNKIIGKLVTKNATP
ncbi:MAG: glycosyltransferase family 2 protein [Syntrophales bacterium]|jgi:glycosyltransferase involved in cell wall biosynthesis|nr:glycosyltransferase family 2 protein [Syntrophales bacterium]